jgi:hypothetical protein
MNRTYIFPRAGISRQRARVALAALAAGALLAGCGAGGGGSSTTPATGASSAAAPVVSSSGVEVQATGGSSGGSTAVAGGVAGGQSTGQIANGKTGSFSTASASGSFSSASNATYSHTSDVMVSASQAKQQQNAAAALLKDAASNNSTTTTVATKTKTASKPTSTKKAQSPPKQVTPAKPKTVVRYVTRYKTHIVYRTRTQTVTKTVVKQVKVSPDVPGGAYLPSKHPQLAQSNFTITGTNIGCEIAGAMVRCGIQHRAWAAPLQPSSCKGTWGDTIQLGGNGPPKFACGGNDPISLSAKVIPPGWDDTVGKVTCEIRNFGVNCFSTSRSGFMISRTGYSLY